MNGTRNGCFLIGKDLPEELRAGRPMWKTEWAKASTGTTQVDGAEFWLDGELVLRYDFHHPHFLISGDHLNVNFTAPTVAA